jgi:AraC family transcriptional regulator, regulatory protein of adaptative response / methylated-DNA-[protein]-cysteine methyltransferase
MGNQNILPYPAKTRLERLPLFTSSFSTPLGTMQAIADENRLYLFEFVDCKGFKNHIERIRFTMYATITPGVTSIHQILYEQVERYFTGVLRTFNIPIATFGTSFQKTVWSTLQTIPYGSTWSYTLLANAVRRPKSVRAVARINAFNRFALIVPCHRVVGINGSLGGYNAGINRKAKLLEHEAYILAH